MYQYVPPSLNLSDDDLQQDFWPDAEQELFQDESHWAEAVMIDGVKDWTGYVWSFREAATMLYNAAFAQGGNPGDRDVVFIPFAFLWRHCAELGLKASIIIRSEYLGKPLDLAELCKTHSLIKLWNQFLPLDVEAFPEESVGTRKYAGRIMAQLQKVDATSMQFRYPVDRQGNPHLKGTSRVAMKNFHEVMLGFSHWIESGFEAISHNMSSFGDAGETIS